MHEVPNMIGNFSFRVNEPGTDEIERPDNVVRQIVSNVSF